MTAPRILTPPFLTAAVANFLFFTNLSAFFLLPLHLQALGATETQLGLIMGVYSAVGIVCQPVVGAWVDRAGRRPFMLGGAGLAVTAALGFAAWPDTLWVFPLLRVLQGLAFSAYFIANFTVIVDLVPATRRAQALGIFGISGLVSTAMGPAVGELVAQAFGFRVFFATAAGVAGGALVISARIAEPPRQRTPSAEGLLGLLRGVIGAPRLPMALGVVFGLGLGVVFTFFPPHAAALGVERVGLFAVAYSLAALTVRATAGRLMDAVRRRAVIVPALAVQALAAAVLAVMAPLVGAGVSAVALLFVAGLAAGTAHGFLYPALTALVMDLTPEDRRGRVVGVFSAFVLAGNASGAVGFGVLAHGVGYGPMFAVLAVVLGGGVALAFRLER